MSREQRPFRKSFIRRLSMQLYAELKKTQWFSSWNTSEIYMLSKDIVSNKEGQINHYLDSHEVTLGTIEKESKVILKKILLPEIEKIRI